MFQAFDYPTPFTSVGRRSTSNVPAQALALMNGPLVVELAKQWSERMLKETQPDINYVTAIVRNDRFYARERIGLEKALLSQSLSIRIGRLYHEAFSRNPTTEETTAATEFVAEQAKLYGTKEDDPRVWADLCHVLFNAKEFIYVQ